MPEWSFFNSDHTTFMCLPYRKNPGTMIAKEDAGLFLRGEETRVHGSRKIFVGSMLAATILVAGLTELYISSPPIADTEQAVIQSNEYSAEWYLSEIAQKYPEFTVLDYASPPDEQQGIVRFAAIAQGEDDSQTDVFVADAHAIQHMRLDMMYLSEEGFTVLPQDRICFTVQDMTTQQIFDYEVIYQSDGKNISYRVNSQPREKTENAS